mmetsp:Transcript_31245/g.52495  ORF Transcript_31245/g.52495 Transcript_31245/m.52495 type:complete len:211 (+) Transcript_31245:1635-2267(+)
MGSNDQVRQWRVGLQRHDAGQGRQHGHRRHADGAHQLWGRRADCAQHRRRSGRGICHEGEHGGQRVCRVGVPRGAVLLRLVRDLRGHRPPGQPDHPRLLEPPRHLRVELQGDGGGIQRRVCAEDEQLRQRRVQDDLDGQSGHRPRRGDVHRDARQQVRHGAVRHRELLQRHYLRRGPAAHRKAGLRFDFEVGRVVHESDGLPLGRVLAGN